MAGTLQIELRQGDDSLGLNTSPYTLDSYSSGGRTLELDVRVTGSTMAQVERYVSVVERWIKRAGAHAGQLLGDAVYVYSKVCDDLGVMAELGAGWVRKRITGGSVIRQKSQPPHTTITLRLSLEVSESWRRAGVESILAGTSDVSARSDGGITSNAAAVTARRIEWSQTTGFTGRIHWIKANADTVFFKFTDYCYAEWDNTQTKFKIHDAGGSTAESAALSISNDTIVELVFVWDPDTPRMAIFRDGVSIASSGSCNFGVGQPLEYTVFNPTGEQSILNVQVWPTALTDAQASALYSWGRPEAELAFYEAPVDSKNTNAVYPIHNVPGNEMAMLRLVLAGDSQDFDQVLVALRPGRIPATVGFECENETLGSNTSITSDTDASGGGVARFTPPDAAWHTEVTVAVAGNPADVVAYLGDYRLFLAGKDNAASVGLNQISFRLAIGDIAGSWSDTVSFGSVATRSLVELGELHIPPGAWPEETIDATTDVHGGVYAKIEIRVKNIAATGTLDLDAIYLAPSEAEGVADVSDWDVLTQYAVLDFASDPAAMILVADAVSLEFAGWIDYLGDRLSLLPGSENLLWLFGMRDSAEQAFPNDALAAYLFFAPNWRR